MMPALASVSILALCTAAVPVAAQDSISTLRRMLASPAPATREAAFNRLHEIPRAFAQPGMSTAIARLLDVEQRLIVTEAEKGAGIAAEYGEEFGEYVGAVQSACLSYCDLRDPFALHTLAVGMQRGTALAPRFAARFGDRVVDVYVAQIGAGKVDQPHDAVEMLGLIATSNHGLSPAQLSKIDGALIGAIAVQGKYLVAEQALREIGRLAEHGVAPSRRAILRAAVVHASTDTRPGVRAAAQFALAGFSK